MTPARGMPFPNLSTSAGPFPLYLTNAVKFNRKSSVDSSSGSSSRRKSSTCSSSSTNSTAPSSTGSPRPAYSSHFPPSILTSATAQAAQPTFLSGSTSRLRCARCLADLALSSQIISKGFTGRHGRAYLVAPASMHTNALPPPPCSSVHSATASGTRGGAVQPLTSTTTASGRAGSSRAATTAAAAAAAGDLPNTFVHRPVPRHLVTGHHTVGDISCALCGSVLGWKYVAAEEEAQRYKVGKFILEARRVVVWDGWEEQVEEEGEVPLTRGGPVGGERRGVTGPGKRKEVMVPQDGEEVEIEFDSQDEDECEDLFMGVWTPQNAVRRRRMKRFELAK